MTNDDKARRGQVNTAAAETYEEFFVPALFGEWPPHAIRASQIRAGQSVLDVACGTGVVARELVKATGDASLVTGIDINDGMLAVAARKAPEVKWIRAPVEKLPFADEIFDAVICQFALMFFEDRELALREMHRVLKKGGRLVVLVWDGLDTTPGYRDMVALIERICGSLTADALRAPFILGDVWHVKQIFADAGFPSVTVETIPGTARFPSLADWVNTDVKGWTLRDLITDEQLSRLHEEAPSHLRDHVHPDGTVAFAAPAHIITVRK